MHAPQDSPIFNGDPYSLGGNGQYIPHNGTVITPPEGVSGGDIQLPAGVGGGYVVTGPFANLTINLGPFGGTFGTEPGPDGGLGYNPRGLKRDVGPGINERYCNYTTVHGKCKSLFTVLGSSPVIVLVLLTLSISSQCFISPTEFVEIGIPFDADYCPDLLEKPTISDYRLLSEGVPYTVEIGPHGGGHYVIK